jgi:uncharacterized metal-binding protein YceD (DUF177 family)
MDLELFNSGSLIVKTSTETLNESNDELIVLAPHEHTINLKQFILDTLATGLPYKRTHAKGECNPEMTQYIGRNSSKNTHEATDPRWDELKKLLNIKNN